MWFRYILGILLMSSSLYATEATALVSLSSRIQDPAWPRRVLITNDNGIDDLATVALARMFAKFADTFLVAPLEDQSGTTNLLSVLRNGRFEVERRDLGRGVSAWGLDGYPADCVLFALAGPMRDALPDLVISGVNGGPNLADEWFGSGTIGAARTAAYFGVPAIAVSGVEDDDPHAVEAVVDWVVRFAQSEAVRRLGPQQYLTISLPVVPPSEIKGVKIASRARGLIQGIARREPNEGSSKREIWSFELSRRSDNIAADTDVLVVQDHMIAIVPMRVDESDPMMREWLELHKELLPAWDVGRTQH